MLRHTIFITLFISNFFISSAQTTHSVKKDKTATNHAVPTDNTPIDKIVSFTGDYFSTGYKVGDTVPDITFYSRDNKAVCLSDLLKDTIPVLLVSGSYTCPNFRFRANDLNRMTEYYKGKINTYLIYTLEAHPNNAINPYMDSICVGPANERQGILYPQHATYGDRKAMVDTMKAKMAIRPTVLIDGPGNRWWKEFGPAPNIAYLIDTKRIVRAKNVSLNAMGDNMWCDIDHYLGTRSGKCPR
ncbi:MAG: hypothetical protein BGO69_04385 [Bacteroidetes bacterium 46-16]|nr:MAG: hypothetical protein BGO69_04385 [Bacteroidetes bacterium 46-16]